MARRVSSSLLKLFSRLTWRSTCCWALLRPLLSAASSCNMGPVSPRHARPAYLSMTHTAWRTAYWLP